MNLRLVSFRICPFVQRSAITLLEKGIDYEITYIDLDNPPDWFLAISPFGKVPLLCVDRPCETGSTQTAASGVQTESAVIFESAVIMEFLNDIHPPSMHPDDPLQRARNRQWIEFDSNMNFQQHNLLCAADKEAYDNKLEEVRKDFRQVEDQLTHAPFFNGERFSLIDASYAPTLQRYKLVEPVLKTGLFEAFPKMDQWARALISRESVQKSVVADFEARMINTIIKWDGYAARFF